MRHSCYCLTPWPWSDVEAFLFKSWALVEIVTLTFTLQSALIFTHHSVLLFVSPPSTLGCLLLFSRVSMSNCSGPQSEGKMERKREKMLCESTFAVYEKQQEWGELERSMNYLCVCLLWKLLCICCGCEDRGSVWANEAQWDHWSAESAMCVLN